MNYGQLRANVISLINRSDCTDDLAAQFVQMAVARVQRDPSLRIPSLERLQQTVIGSTFDGVDIPNDLLQIINVYTDTETLERVELGRFLREQTKGISTPKFFMTMGNQIKLVGAPAQGSTISLHYYGADDALVADSDESYLASIAPDLLTYGACSFAADFFIDDRKESFEAGYATLKQELIDFSVAYEMSAPMSIQPTYSGAEF